MSLLDHFRKKPTPTVPYNETLDYKYMDVTGVKGLYTKQPVAIESLPEGYKAYALIGKSEYTKIIPAPSKKGDALFICKADNNELSGSDSDTLTEKDYAIQEETEFGWYDFQAFFGHSVVFDLLVKDAEKRQEQQASSKNKDQTKENISPK